LPKISYLIDKTKLIEVIDLNNNRIDEKSN